MIQRCLILIMLMAGAVAVRATLAAPVEATNAESLSRFPSSLATWRGQDSALAADVVRVAAVDDYLNRYYRSGRDALGLYVGYYRSQHQGESLHSPLFCLPASGWQPISTDRADLHGDDGVVHSVNRLVIERGLDRLLVLYWYQTASRITASEYSRKLFLMRDAFGSHRTDVALVRVVAPLGGHDGGSENASLGIARPFAELVLPEVQRRLFPK